LIFKAFRSDVVENHAVYYASVIVAKKL